MYKRVNFGFSDLSYYLNHCCYRCVNINLCQPEDYDYDGFEIKGEDPSKSKCPGFGEVCCYESNVVRKGADFFD